MEHKDFAGVRMQSAPVNAEAISAGMAFATVCATARSDLQINDG